MAHTCTLRACVHVSLQGTAGLLRRRLAGTRTTCLLLMQVRGQAPSPRQRVNWVCGGRLPRVCHLPSPIILHFACSASARSPEVFHALSRSFPHSASPIRTFSPLSLTTTVLPPLLPQTVLVLARKKQ